MADDSPGKVQALRAIFAEKNKPVMGVMPAGNKITNRLRKSISESSEDSSHLRHQILGENRISSQLKTKVISVRNSELISIANADSHKVANGLDEKANNKANLKPSVGPKPARLSQQIRTSANSKTSDSCDIIDTRTSSTLITSQAKTKAVADTIATFMFTNGFTHKTSESSITQSSQPPSSITKHTSDSTITKYSQPLPSLHLNRASQVRSNSSSVLELNNGVKKCENLSKSDAEKCCDLINSDNYICKSKFNVKRREIPPVGKLGPPPVKPLKPPHIELPEKYRTSKASQPKSVQNGQQISQPLTSVPRRPAPQRPSHPCPPRPHTPPPLPPVAIKAPLTLREEIEELYEDTILGDNKRPVSLIPELTAEEEEAEELYNDADELPPLPLKPKDLPPPCPSEYLKPNVHNTQTEELYQDAEDFDDEEFYEVMPCEALTEEGGSPLYSNNKKEVERLRREEEKKVRREQKEREKKDKEMEKLKRKFGLTGDEIPIDDGLVKLDSRGGKGDLPVRRGETVLILRMEGNPSGRWLVKNEKGKIGYVELTNIEVDPLSVKTVMVSRRQSAISASEELYSEAVSEEEAIYEVTY